MLIVLRGKSRSNKITRSGENPLSCFVFWVVVNCVDFLMMDDIMVDQTLLSEQFCYERTHHSWSDLYLSCFCDTCARNIGKKGGNYRYKAIDRRNSQLFFSAFVVCFLKKRKNRAWIEKNYFWDLLYVLFILVEFEAIVFNLGLVLWGRSNLSNNDFGSRWRQLWFS